MKETSKEYAEALFSLSQETGSMMKDFDALVLINRQFQEYPDYLEFLACPSIPAAERVAAIDEAFSDSASEYVIAMVSLFCEKGHIKDFAECVEAYRALLLETTAKTVAYVKSVVPLSEEEKSRLRKSLEKKCGHAVELTCSMDESILGGMIVEMDGRIIDGSLRTRLRRMKEVMNG